MAKPRKPKPDASTALVPAPPIGMERKRHLENKRWYADERQPHEAVTAVVKSLAQSGRRSELDLWLALFLDRQPRGADAARHAIHRPGMRARFNVIRNAIGVLKARVGRTMPRPWITTVGGDWRLQRKAKKFQRYIEGDLERLSADRLRRQALLDALVFGVGCVKVGERDGRVGMWRVWTGNVLKHPREEAIGGSAVRTMYEIAFVDREVLAAEYPDERRKIERLPRADRTLLRFDGSDDHDDLVLVSEAWHLPHSMDDNGEWQGGRHSIVTADCTLDDDDWQRDHFPIAEMHCEPNPGCEVGIGYPELLAGLQSEQNSLAELASDVARLMTPKWVCPNGSKLTPMTLSNGIEVWEVEGEMPQILSAENVILAVMQAAGLQRQEMYAIIGVSDTSAEGSSDDNLDSGKAQLVHRDIEGERQFDLFQNFEQFTIDIVERQITCSEEIAKRGDGAAAKLVAYHGKRLLTELRWTDVALGDDPYHVRTSPVSKLSGSPQAQLAQLQEMVKAGWISQERAQQIYDMPDLDAAGDLDYAGNELARQLIDAAIEIGDPGEDGQGIPATRACNLPYLVLEGWKQHAMSQLEGASEDDLVALRDLLGHAQTLIDQQLAEEAKKAAALAPPPPPMPPAAALPPAPPAGPTPLQVVP